VVSFRIILRRAQPGTGNLELVEFFFFRNIKHPYSSFTHKFCKWIKSPSLEDDDVKTY
jgi:hypothetical protein